MRYKNILALTILSVALYGCTPDQERVKIENKVISETSVEFDGVKITKVGTFKDNSAYGQERCVYRIVDSKQERNLLGLAVLEYPKLAITHQESLGILTSDDQTDDQSNMERRFSNN